MEEKNVDVVLEQSEEVEEVENTEEVKKLKKKRITPACAGTIS